MSNYSEPSQTDRLLHWHVHVLIFLHPGSSICQATLQQISAPQGSRHQPPTFNILIYQWHDFSTQRDMIKVVESFTKMQSYRLQHWNGELWKFTKIHDPYQTFTIKNFWVLGFDFVTSRCFRRKWAGKWLILFCWTWFSSIEHISLTVWFARLTVCKVRLPGFKADVPMKDSEVRLACPDVSERSSRVGWSSFKSGSRVPKLPRKLPRFACSKGFQTSRVFRF